MIYTDALKLNSEIKNYSWIGGWEDGNDILLYRRENGKRIIQRVKNIPRYFCISFDDFNKIDKSLWKIWQSRGYLKSLRRGSNYIYIISEFVGKRNWFTNWLKELHDMGVEPLEGDISRLQRFIIDCDVKITSPLSENSPRYCYWDLETYDGNDQIRIGEDRILSCAVKADNGDELFLCLEEDNDESEIKLITSIFKTLLEYDVNISFNGYAFDIPYLEGRLDYYKIERTKLKQICQIDLYNQYERQGTFYEYHTKDRKLNTIGLAIIGEGKIEHKEKVHELWSTNKDLLKQYNLQDIRLLYKLEEKLGSAHLVMDMMSQSGIPYNLSHSPLRLVESFLLRSAARKRDNKVLDFRFGTSYYLPEHNLGGGSVFSRNSLASDRRKGRAEALEEFGIEYNPIEGAYVMESTPAYVHNVASFDFNSLYPHVMIGFNVCWSTLIKSDSNISSNSLPNGTRFRTDYHGIMPDAVEFLLDERRRIKARMEKETDEALKSALDIQQKSVKILANSFYGVAGLWGSRFYNHDIGEAITCFGRYALPMGQEYFDAGGRKVVVQDTDSMYVSLKENDDPIQLMNGYIKILREDIMTKFNCYRPEAFKMGYEKHFITLLVIKKKMYAGMVDYDGKPIESKLVIKGLKLIKSDTTSWASKIAKQILEEVLSGKYEYDHFERLLKEEREKLITGQIPLIELQQSSRLGKELREYVGENPLVYVRIARRMMENGYSVTTHQTINYYITDGSTPMQGMGNEEVEQVGEIELDMVHYYNTGLLQIVCPILETAFPEVDWNKLRFPKKLKKNNYFQCKYIYKLGEQG